MTIVDWQRIINVFGAGGDDPAVRLNGNCGGCAVCFKVRLHCSVTVKRLIKRAIIKETCEPKIIKIPAFSRRYYLSIDLNRIRGSSAHVVPSKRHDSVAGERSIQRAVGIVTDERKTIEAEFFIRPASGHDLSIGLDSNSINQVLVL